MNPVDKGSVPKRRLLSLPSDILGVIAANVSNVDSLKVTNASIWNTIEKSSSYWKERLVAIFGIGKEGQDAKQMYKRLEEFQAAKLSYSLILGHESHVDIFVNNPSSKINVRIENPEVWYEEFNYLATAIANGKLFQIRIPRYSLNPFCIDAIDGNLKISSFQEQYAVDMTIPMQRKAFSDFFSELAAHLEKGWKQKEKKIVL